MIIDIADKSCPCCGGGLHKIGETQKEMFDVVPIQYRVKRIIRPRYGCRACESAVVQAPAPEQPVDGGMVCEAFLAHIATMKHAYHVPLYRLEQMLAAQGIALDRSTLALWMGRTAWWLKPLHQLLLETALSYPRLFADETPIPMLDPGRGRTKTCQFWAVATDDRPWCYSACKIGSDSNLMKLGRHLVESKKESARCREPFILLRLCRLDFALKAPSTMAR